MKKYNIKNQENINHVLSDAYLNMKVDSEKFYNPLMNIPKDIDQDLYYMYLLADPNYFYFICKEILGIDLHPFQCVILKELWNHKFPMLIASRGSSKTFMLAVYSWLRLLLLPGRKVVLTSASFRQSKLVFENMEKMWFNSAILRDIGSSSTGNGPKHSPDRYYLNVNDSSLNAIPTGDGCVSSNTLITYSDKFGYINESIKNILVWGNGQFVLSDEAYINGNKPTKIITTKRGCEIEGTFNHKIKILDETNNIIWKRFDELIIGDKTIIDKTERWHSGTVDLSVDECYSLGLMIGDGSWVDKNILRYTTEDNELIESLIKFTNLEFRPSSDDVHWNCYGIENHKNWVEKFGVKDLCYTKDKCIPDKLLCAEKDKMAALISGIFDTDGTVRNNTHKGGIGIDISLTNTSKKLVQQIQYILLHYGIVSTLKYRDRNIKWNRVYELTIYGVNVKKFHKEIGFRLERKRETLAFGINNKKRWPTQEKYLDNNQNIIIDIITKIVDSKCYTYDIQVPSTHEYCANGFFSHNSTIRGLRANDIISDERQSISQEVFETVISGFAAVVANPIEAIKHKAKVELAKKMGVELTDEENAGNKPNQIILAGTADFDFTHFASDWKKWKKIIESKGDKDRLKLLFNDGIVPEDFNWKDYCVMRIPFELIPAGFMDNTMIARAKATVHSGVYLGEYGSVFSKDSHGFFKRTIIEKCVCSDKKPIIIDNHEIFFKPMLTGFSDKKYVMALDPASERDNFAITIVEANPSHRKVAYVWTTTRQEHQLRKAAQSSIQDDFYDFCCSKIKELMKRFNIVRIGMDSQGGGITILERLGSRDTLKTGEVRILPIIDYDNPQPTDSEDGLHMIQLIQFSNAEWVSDANHGLRLDLEKQLLLFPFFDIIDIANIESEDKHGNRIYDTIEDAYLEIEELKTELTTIVMTRTQFGRDRWDVPTVKDANNKKGRLKKDRYSALIIADYLAKLLVKPEDTGMTSYISSGGFASKDTGKTGGQLYAGGWAAKALSQAYGE